MDFTDTFSKGFICLGLIRLPGTCFAKRVEKTCDLENVRDALRSMLTYFDIDGTPKWIAERKRARHATTSFINEPMILEANRRA
jgi:hypothetical protein